jgi:signal transduction histidine kinase
MKRALPIAGLTVTLALLNVLLFEPFFIEPSGLHWTNDPSTGLAVMGLSLGLGIVGALLSWHRPEQSIGWLMLAFGATFAAQLVCEEFAIVAFREGQSSLSSWLVFGMNVLQAITFPLLAALLIVFPSGRPTSRWGRSGIGVVLVCATLLVALAPFAAYKETLIGIYLPSLHTVADANGYGFFLTIPVFLVMFVAGVRVVTLLFRGTQVERHQVRWVAFTLVLIGVLLLLSFWIPAAPTAAGIVVAIGIPLSIGIAITRYHLYDIDIIISRSLSFGVLVVFIGGVYVGIVVGLGALLDRVGGSGFGLSVVATAVVALGFQPVRVRVERWANRLVYGKRATPYEVLARFSHRAAEESDEDVLGRIPRLIVDGTGAQEAALWVRTGGGFRTVSVWPGAASERVLEGASAFEDPDGDVSLPVVHDGELLGGVSLVAARGGSITPPELELVASLADGLGLTLRNSQLTGQLRRQVKDLQRSRDRVVSAADEARRSLEHDLDSGPQQQLVAVKVKLGPLRRMAEQAGAERTAVVLADIEAQASDAIQAVRDFAAGIYPPLLGAEGLAVALGQEVHKAALPVELEVDGVGRYPRDVEAAVYFSILEALQNTAKYAEASQAIVRLRQRDGDLRFEVVDNGRGFDPAATTRGAGLNGIADRIDTIGGTWTITSTPGNGTTVAGAVPVDDQILATVGIT